MQFVLAIQLDLNEHDDAPDEQSYYEAVMVAEEMFSPARLIHHVSYEDTRTDLDQDNAYIEMYTFEVEKGYEELVKENMHMIPLRIEEEVYWPENPDIEVFIPA